MQIDEKTRVEQTYAHLRPHHCPTCNSNDGFDFLGDQTWPQRLVEKIGVGPVVTLWQCRACDTTITIEP